MLLTQHSMLLLLHKTGIFMNQNKPGQLNNNELEYIVIIIIINSITPMPENPNMNIKLRRF